METIPPSSQLMNETLAPPRISSGASEITRRLQWRLLTLGLVLSDFVAVALAFRIAYFVRFEISPGFFQADADPLFVFYQTSALLLVPLWLFIFALVGLYNRQIILSGTKEYALVFNATTAGLFIVIAAGFLQPQLIFARGWLLMAWGLIFLLASLGRFSIRRGIYYFRRHGYFIQNAVIIGANSEGISLAEQLTNRKTSGLQVIGFIDQKYSPGACVSNNLEVLGNVDHLPDLVIRYDIEELILASSAFTTRDRMLDVFQQFGVSGDVNVRLSSGLYEIFTTGLTVKDFASVPLVSLNKVRLTGIDHFLKLLLDYSLTIPALILIFPFLLLIAIAVKFDSPGPVIFRRRVMGMNGKQFDAYKFRTMSINGDELLSGFPELMNELAENYKLKEDPRVTRAGKFLRKSSLDELPQFFNVLKREMSLVGPRIITPEEVEKYSKWDLNLLTVKPGITGLWQVSGRSDVSYDERVRLDMYYIRNWNIWLDLHILFQTIPAVIRRRGAY